MIAVAYCLSAQIFLSIEQHLRAAGRPVQLEPSNNATIGTSLPLCLHNRDARVQLERVRRHLHVIRACVSAHPPILSPAGASAQDDGVPGRRAPLRVGRRVPGGGAGRAAQAAGRRLRERPGRVRAVPALLLPRDAAGGAGHAPHDAAVRARARAHAAAARGLRGRVRRQALGAAGPRLAAAGGRALGPLAVPPALRGAPNLVRCMLDRVLEVFFFSLTCLRLHLCSLPFGFSEPDVPELLSEDEGKDVARHEDDEDDDGYLDDVPPPPPVDHAACNEALAKLVQVKMQHANRTIPRPDDWLVFDPVQEKLVLQKHATHMNDGVPNGLCNGHATDSKVSLSREQEPIGDSDQLPLGAEPKLADADGWGTAKEQAPRGESAAGIRKRL
ncbi:hypothetical protein ON010_g9995 [Phytophthora cinnamomi]|nr:hypothetical protein ON010_g9995 [Phytophthora cinnamomi]